MAEVDFAALHSLQKHNDNLSSSGGGIGAAEGGRMSAQQYGGDFNSHLQNLASKVEPTPHGNMDSLFEELNQEAAFGENREIDEAFSTLGPTTKEGLKYANDFHNANLGHNVGAQNIALPGASEAKPSIGIPR